MASGVGHLMRTLALAEELVARDIEVVFSSDAASVPFAATALARRGMADLPALESAQDQERFVIEHSLDAMVFDSYTIDPSIYESARRALPTLAMVDGALRGVSADILVDQNLDAEPIAYQGTDAELLLGAEYALIRDEVLHHRPQRVPQVLREQSITKVVVVSGGTDPHGASPLLFELLVETGEPFSAVVISPTSTVDERVRSTAVGPCQRVQLCRPTEELPRLASQADLVLGAAGSSAWELLALGCCAALVAVADNQQKGYDALVAHDAVLGLGRLADLRQRSTRAVTHLRGLLRDPLLRLRYSQLAWELVDGRGRSRVAEALTTLTSNSVR